MRLRLPNVLVLAALLLTGSGWAADAQGQTSIPRIGMLAAEPGGTHKQSSAGFYRELRNQGWIEGKHVAFVYASVDSDPSRYAEAAAELVRLKVDVIFADSAPAVRAAFAATRTIPIVGQDYTTDPVVEGYAESHRRPGGNVTGVFLDAPEFSGKWLELLKAMIPGLSRVAVLWDPSPGETHLRAIESTADSFRVQLQVLEVRNPEDIDVVASRFRGRPQALVILPSPMTWVESKRLARLATKQRLPATSMAPEFAREGGLVAYGPKESADERCAVLVAKILGGARPGDLPIERPAEFGLIINLNAARALNLKIPESVLARADEIIR